MKILSPIAAGLGWISKPEKNVLTMRIFFYKNLKGQRKNLLVL